jgi:hypothetical protein
MTITLNYNIGFTRGVIYFILVFWINLVISLLRPTGLQT